jgi:hypothetical protein
MNFWKGLTMLKALEEELLFAQKTWDEVRSYSGCYRDDEATQYWAGRVHGLKIAIKILNGE